MHGLPSNRELPIYGSKVLAVRDGNVFMHGQHKLPTYTQLNVTANVGDTQVCGGVGEGAGGRSVLDTGVCCEGGWGACQEIRVHGHANANANANNNANNNNIKLADQY